MPNIHIGNNAEFNEQFGRAASLEIRYQARDSSDTYASIASFLSSEPGLVVLAKGVSDDRWWEVLRERLDWPSLSPLVLASDSEQDLSSRAAADPFVLRSLRAADLPSVICWGESPSYRDLVASLPTEVANRSITGVEARRAESKVFCQEVFNQAKRDSPAHIAIPEQQVCGSERELLPALEAVMQSGRTVVLKSEYGVGGFGTRKVSPDFLARFPKSRDAYAALTQTDERLAQWPVLVQEALTRPSSCHSDFTGDGEIDHNSRVFYRGGASMLVDGTHYAGAVTACETTAPPWIWNAIRSFTLAVGEHLAASGYRGWYDVDIVRGVDDRLYPLEINARRTGPVAPLTISARLKDLRGPDSAAVACVDGVVLPRRRAPQAVFDALDATAEGRSKRLIPTSFFGTEDALPTFGFAVGAPTASEAMLRLRHTADELLRNLS